MQINVVKGLVGLYHLFSRAQSVQEEQAVLVVSIRNAIIQPIASGNDVSGRPGTTKFDLSSDLSSQPSAGAANVPVTFSSPIPGILIVYLPRIPYAIT